MVLISLVSFQRRWKLWQLSVICCKAPLAGFTLLMADRLLRITPFGKADGAFRRSAVAGWRVTFWGILLRPWQTSQSRRHPNGSPCQCRGLPVEWSTG